MNSPQEPLSGFDRFSSHYEEHLSDPLKAWIGGDSSDYYLRLKANEILHHLRRLGLDSKRLKALDVGCGTGRVAQMLHQEFLEFHGADSSRGMIERAKKLSLPGVSFKVSDADRLPFETNRFELVYSMCLFHHVPAHAHREVLQEMIRVLCPGGWVFTFEHNALNPLTRLIVKRCPVDEGVRLLYPSQVAALYQELELKQTHTRFILFFPKYTKPLTVMEPHLFWFPLGGQFYVCGAKLT